MPHIHADYQGEVAVYAIEDGSVLAGNLPPQKHKLVVAWIEIHKEDLMADWKLAVNGQNPLEPVAGLTFELPDGLAQIATDEPGGP